MSTALFVAAVKAIEEENAIVQKQEKTSLTYYHAGRRFSLVLMPTASFSIRHSYQHVNFSRSILPRVNFFSREEIVVKKDYVRWRARSGLRLNKAGGRLASGDR